MAVIIAGCNPALQETLQFDAFHLGGVNRVKTHTYSIGGKGQASARAIYSWNDANPSKYNVTCHLLQFMGGQNGKILRNELSKYDKTIKQHTVHIDPQQTRTATTICINDTSEHKHDASAQIHGTEIVKPSPFINRKHQTEFLNKIESCFKEKTANIFQISGTIPRIATDDNAWNECDFYNEMILKTKSCAKDVTVIIDAYKNLPPCIKKKENKDEIPIVDILKINISELQKLIEVDAVWDYKQGMELLSKWIHKFNEMYIVKYLILTDGGNPSYCFDFMCNSYWIFEMPLIPQIMNPIGCGDTCTGIISSVLSQTLLQKEDFMNNKNNPLKWNWTESIIAHATRWGLAAACAATQTMKLGEFEPNVCIEMFDKIKISKPHKL